MKGYTVAWAANGSLFRWTFTEQETAAQLFKRAQRKTDWCVLRCRSTGASVSVRK